MSSTHRLGFISTLALFLLATHATAQGCGFADAPCRTPLGEYYVALPERESENPRPVLLHFHGAGGSGMASTNNRNTFKAFLDAGWVVIAPQGEPREGSEYLGWNLYVPNSGRTRDEVAFAREILEDAEKRFGVDLDYAVASGYSVGGTAVWNVACHAPELFYAFLPVAGGFLRPQPEICQGPVRLLHTHGWLDKTVPIEGRPIRGERLQGDVFQGLQVWRATNNCTTPRPDVVDARDQYWDRTWSDCDAASALRLVLHPGGHSVPNWWAETALNWIEAHRKADSE